MLLVAYILQWIAMNLRSKYGIVQRLCLVFYTPLRVGLFFRLLPVICCVDGGATTCGYRFIPRTLVDTCPYHSVLREDSPSIRLFCRL